MTRFHLTARALAGALASVLAGCVNPVPLPPSVPDALKPDARESLALVVAATGVQIYECRAGKDDTYAWTFVAPEAELFDRSGKRIGQHGAGPRWELDDGSRVVGAAKQRADAPRSGAIPWLLLSARAEQPAGVLASASSVQRINTSGGVAPGSSCGRQNAGAAARVPYTADYYFYSARS